MAETAETLAHQAFLTLEHAIVTLKLRPGSLVTEKDLIELSGQGRTPVREAIQKLAWQGLIEVRPRVGLLITRIEPEDYSRIMAVRRALEPLAAELVARNATEADRKRLIACAQTMTSCAATGDMTAFLGADKLFDEVLEAACPNRFLVTALAPLQSHARRLWFSTATTEKMDRSIALHVAVIRAVQQGEADKAGRAMLTLIDTLSGL